MRAVRVLKPGEAHQGPVADTLIWLDLPFPLVMWRLLRRTLGRIRSRQDLWGTGNRESFRGAFLSRDSILLWTTVADRHRDDRLCCSIS